MGPDIADREATRPFLLLDVDGVVNCFGGAWTREYQLAHFDLFRAYGLPIRVPKGMGERVSRLAGVFEMVWATRWMERAHERFAETLRIARSDPWPWIELSATGGASPAAKLAGIMAFADRHAGRPIAWVDDEAGLQAAQWAAQRSAAGAPTVVVRPDPAVGLTDSHVDQLIRRFEEQENASGSAPT